MRKAFTLIELMITMLLATIFLTFVFRFYTNVLAERYYLEAKDSLTYNGFRALQIMKNGVYRGGDYIGGIITLNNNPTIDLNVIDGRLVMGGSYIFNDLNITDTNVSLIPITNGLYSIEFNATKKSVLEFSSLNQTDVVKFQRLVYTQ